MPIKNAKEILIDYFSKIICGIRFKAGFKSIRNNG
jgi:hypothetical protein